ncbi:LBF_2017 N-terminal domain-containing protein [Leptospira sp. GIMC2001]|uniref:LBF_2017 N-terminal domain-containing protein n=1 Tax=Leptospira sp. GIMC2001 TaxID=1513297 RepID=UPI00234A31BE|nr:hypothetical protein [Leptospira sp. GIMC2001]WCL49004.1 hypothetical protein O4O04_17175 [Leptospira sp. GIMC2001]
MSRARILVFGLLFFALYSVVIAETAFQITTDSEPDSHHEIEFLKSQTDDKNSEILKFKSNQFKSPVNKEYPYFRVRRVGQYDAMGFWSDIYSTKDFIGSESAKKIIETAPPQFSKGEDVFIVIEEKGKKLYYLNGDKVGIAVSSTDEGKTKTYYRLNGGEWNIYSKEGLRFIQDGEYQMDYYSEDRIGNRESAKSVTFIVDIKPPESQIKIVNDDPIGAEATGFISARSLVQIDRIDEVSGIEKSFYKFLCNGGKSSDYREYEKAFVITEPINFCKSGFQIQYFSVDKVGNREDAKTYLFSYQP